MKIAVLQYYTRSVDIITVSDIDLEQKWGGDVESFLFDHCNYDPDDIHYMCSSDILQISVNFLTPEDFG